MSNLILLRHGQSKWNLERRFTGWADIGLTEKGKLEAEYAGQLIKKLNIEFHTCFASELKRAINSLEIILKILNNPNTKIYKNSALNERNYAGLTSLNREDVIQKYGKKQVKIWRRSFDIPPPKMEDDHPYKNKINEKIPAESLKDTFQRVVPYYNEKIQPLIKSNKNVLVVFHGNSCRALLMNIFNISKEKIVEIEVPTSNPIMIEFDDGLKVKKYKYLDEKRAKKILFNV